ncbi:helix-turn-helix domain-containing protein [Nonomuraea mangrovi]|uniref:Helix-turn-helix domain-containing protein n=1 Tax=Nonomuraea mangrovi TaxID=2316207 RepID=A0ABW4SXE2_9ACTN
MSASTPSSASDQSKVLTAWAKDQFDDWIGIPDGHHVDFKKSPYALDTHKGAFELCKDVAAFRNARGGLIVVGVDAAGARPADHGPARPPG